MEVVNKAPFRLHLIAGARPNFMKVAPLYHALKNEGWCDVKIIHTGQHYDSEMSSSFFKDLELPAPHINLNVGSGSHAEQTAKNLVAYENVCRESPPDLVVVVGDVNSTFATCLTAKKMGLKVAHLEAGLRCFDRTMPEELNRVLTDSISDYHWTPSPDANENLKKEGISSESISFVGNIMIDSYLMLEKKILAERLPEGLTPKGYGVVTLHRPVNTDSKENLEAAVEMLLAVSKNLPLVFPVHPRTRSCLTNFGLLKLLEASHGQIRLLSPMGYTQFMRLLQSSALAITDSGGIQEETSFLGIPCFTLRPSTERPITLTHGTNRLTTFSKLPQAVAEFLQHPNYRRPVIEYWDGRSASRIAALIRNIYARSVS